MAGELETIEIVSNPGDDSTYSSDGEDNTIIFRATWAALVSVRGADLIFTLGDEEREAFCPQTEDCGTCPVLQIECTYVVQPGDLDERRRLHTASIGPAPLPRKHHAQRLEHQPGNLHHHQHFPGMRVAGYARQSRSQG